MCVARCEGEGMPKSHDCHRTMTINGRKHCRTTTYVPTPLSGSQPKHTQSL